MAHSWFTGADRNTHSTASLPQLPPGPSPLCFSAGLLVRRAGPGEGRGTACGAQLGAWGETAEAAGLEVQLLSWAGGGDAQEAPQASRPQPPWESAGRGICGQRQRSTWPLLCSLPLWTNPIPWPSTALPSPKHSAACGESQLDPLVGVPPSRLGEHISFIPLVFSTAVWHLGQWLLNSPRCLWGGRAPTLSHRGSADGWQGFQSLSHPRAPGRHEQGCRAPSSGPREHAQLRAGRPLVDLASTRSSGPDAL